MDKRGFTLIELLAVIVILAIILAITVPSISSLVNNTTTNAFESDAKMIVHAIKYKLLSDASFVPDSLNTSNLNTLNLSNDNYEILYVRYVKNEPYIFISGKNKWAGMYACGNGKDMIIYHDGDTVVCKFEYEYTGNYQSFTAPEAGTYKLQVWGAQGGYGGDGFVTNTNWNPGEGGYSEGEISLSAGQSIYVYVGGRGNGIPGQTYNIGTVYGGWNGGGNAYHDGHEFGGGGGGATDVRTASGNWNDVTSLNSRIIVAGGGGGTGEDGEKGGNGGGLTSSGDFNSSFTATQTAAGLFGGFGYGASYRNSGESNGCGGGGYYGGGGGVGSVADHSCYSACGSGGGSGYIGGVTNGLTIAGDASMPSSTGGTQTGQVGNGYAIITYSNK